MILSYRSHNVFLAVCLLTIYVCLICASPPPPCVHIHISFFGRFVSWVRVMSACTMILDTPRPLSFGCRISPIQSVLMLACLPCSSLGIVHIVFLMLLMLMMKFLFLERYTSTGFFFRSLHLYCLFTTGWRG